MLEKIKKIILDYFDVNVINEELYPQSEKIRMLINKFTDCKLDWRDRGIFVDFRNTFPGYNVFDHTFFYKNDRCLRLIVEKSLGMNCQCFGVMVSIFGFFTVYSCDYDQQADETFIIHPIEFIDKGSNPLCDTFYRIVLEYYPEVIWLPKEIIEMKVQDIGLPNLNYRPDISVGDVLFTQTL